MKKLILILFVCAIGFTLRAQEVTAENPDKNIGLGVGIDYGGFGGRFTYMPVQKFGLFAAVGYNLVGVGFNGGVTYKFSPAKKVTPTLGAMYGYNGVIKVEDGDEDSETYYGASFSFGVEVKTRGNSGNFWNFEILLPLRSSEFSDDIDRLKDIGYDVTDPLPIAFSVGYHFGMD